MSEDDPVLLPSNSRPPGGRSFPLLCRFLGRRHDVTLHALMRPASEKRQGTKSREVGQRRCSERYGDLMLAPIWNCARNASTTSPACLQRVRSGECNSHFVARSERNSGPSAH